MFDGFISYSHTANGELAPALQRGLQRLAKPWYRPRALRIFRDDSALSADPHLWSSIKAALDDSERLVVLACPDAAASSWVARELEYWLEGKSADRILVVVTDGTCSWDVVANRLVGSAVPAELGGAFGDEPRFIDLTWARDGAELTLENSRFRDAVAELAAPMHGVGKDELESEDVRQHRRTRRLVRATIVALATLMIAAIVAAGLADRNARQARRARDDADFQRVVAQAENVSGTDTPLALLLAAQARELRDTPESRGALQEALMHDPRFLGSFSDETAATSITSMCPLAGDQLAITTTDGSLRFVDAATGQGIDQPVAFSSDIARLADGGAGWVSCGTSPDGTALVVVSSDGSVWSIDGRTHRVIARRRVSVAPNDVAVGSARHAVAIGAENGEVAVWDNNQFNGAPRMLRSGDAPVAVAFSPDGATLATTRPDDLLLWDTVRWRQHDAIADPPSTYQTSGITQLPEPDRTLRFSPDGRELADSRRTATRVIDIATGDVRWQLAVNSTDAVPTEFIPRTKDLLTVDPGGRVARFDATSGRRASAEFTTGGSFAISLDGSTLFISDFEGVALQRWALDGRSAIGHRIGRAGQREESFSPDGRTMLTSPDTTSPFVTESDAWDVTTGRHLAHIPLAAFPQLVNDHTVAGYFVARGGVDRLDLKTGRYVGPHVSVRVSGAVIAGNDPAGHLLIAYDDGSIDYYLPDGRKIGAPWVKLPSVADGIIVSPHGLAAVSTDDGRTRFYDLARRKLLYPPIDDLDSTDFSTDGRLVAGFTNAGAPVVLNAQTGTRVGQPLTAVFPDVSRVFFSGDDLVLSSYTSAQLFDPHSGRAIGTAFPTLPTGQEPRVRPNAREVATETADGVVLWDLDPDDWQRAACRLAGRNLTRQEWSQYFGNVGSYRKTCPQWRSPS